MTTEKIWEKFGSLPPVLWAISTPTCPTCLTCPTSRRQYTATFAAPKVQPQNPPNTYQYIPILLNPSQYIPIPNSTQARYPTATLPSASVLLRRDKSGFVTLRRDKRSPCKSTLSRRSLGEDGSPCFSLAKRDLASHLVTA